MKTDPVPAAVVFEKSMRRFEFMLTYGH